MGLGDRFKSVPRISFFVIPANAGIQRFTSEGGLWIPAFAGMTVFLGLG